MSTSRNRSGYVVTLKIGCLCLLAGLLLALVLTADLQAPSLEAAASSERVLQNNIPSDPQRSNAFCEGVGQIPKLECEALVALYTSTGGDTWGNSSGWLTTTTPCTTWYGVGCDGTGHVTQLYLINNGLDGAIPPTLVNLDHLRIVSLTENRLSGVLPDELGGLSRLEELNLQNNELSGSVPRSFGNLGALRFLSLGGNRLSGPIPHELAQLSQLDSLYLWGNQLSGSIPIQLGDLPNLVDLDLNSNQLTGTIPAELGRLSKLKTLNLNHNQLAGTIPPELDTLATLSHLLLGGNRLEGGVPVWLGNLTKLTDLHLFHNRLAGNIPDSLGGLGLLRALYMDGNQLSGDIPASLGNLESLEGLNLSNNRLSGSIPRSFGNLSHLQGFNLRNNQLSGNVPEEVADLTNIVGLEIGYNMLTATDPRVIVFLNSRNPGWDETQTVPPRDVEAVALASDAIRIRWTPIPYTEDGGHYEIQYSSTPGGPYSSILTADKGVGEYVVQGLLPATTYYFAVRTFTPVHGEQQNSLLSAFSPTVSATTLTAGGATVTAIPGLTPTPTGTPTPTASPTSTATPPPSGTAMPKPWLAIVYLNGDNDLEIWMHVALNRLEIAACNPNIDIVGSCNMGSVKARWPH